MQISQGGAAAAVSSEWPADPESPAGTEMCNGAELLRRLGVSEEEAGTAAEGLRFPVRTVRAGRSLVLEGGLIKSLYLVLDGSFKCFQTDAEGHERVQRFPARGDVIGIDGLEEGCHVSGAVALEDARVVALPFRELARLGREVPALQRLLYRCAGREQEQRNRCQQVRALAGAEARLARLLEGIAMEQGGAGAPARRLRLPMSRCDLASHLDLSPAVFGRALSALEEGGFIEAEPGEIVVLDAPGLARLQQRGWGEPEPEPELPRPRGAAPLRARRMRMGGDAKTVVR